MFGMVAESHYLQLNRTQCETTYQLSLSKADVSLVNTTTYISRVEHAGLEVLDPTLNLPLVVVDSYSLSFITTSFYTSTVGDPFMKNIRNLHTNRPAWSSVNNPDYEAIVHDTIADLDTSVLVDSLVTSGSAASSFLNATQVVNATAKMSAVQIDSTPFVRRLSSSTSL